MRHLARLASDSADLHGVRLGAQLRCFASLARSNQPRSPCRSSGAHAEPDTGQPLGATPLRASSVPVKTRAESGPVPESHRTTPAFVALTLGTETAHCDPPGCYLGLRRVPDNAQNDIPHAYCLYHIAYRLNDNLSITRRGISHGRENHHFETGRAASRWIIHVQSHYSTSNRNRTFY